MFSVFIAAIKTENILALVHLIGIGMKLHIYLSNDSSNDSSTAIILVHTERHKYELVKWNTKLDTFERGQWVCRAKISTTRSYISADGQYFKYKLSKWEEDSWPWIFENISKVPYFTALYSYSITDRYAVGQEPSVTHWYGLAKLPDTMEVDGGKLLKSGRVIFDATHDTFQNIAAPYKTPTEDYRG